MSSTFGDMKVTTLVEMTTTSKAADKKMSSSMKGTMTFSGGKIDTAWATIKGKMEGYTSNDSKHSLTITRTQNMQLEEPEDITKTLESFQINQNGTKIKIPAGTMRGDKDSPEVIMSKQ
jgi:hypothetical protein